MQTRRNNQWISSIRRQLNVGRMFSFVIVVSLLAGCGLSSTSLPPAPAATPTPQALTLGVALGLTPGLGELVGAVEGVRDGTGLGVMALIVVVNSAMITLSGSRRTVIVAVPLEMTTIVNCPLNVMTDWSVSCACRATEAGATA